MKNEIKVAVLWSIILAGLIVHGLIELIPLFYGTSVVMAGADGTMPSGDMWMMLVFYLVPMVFMAFTVLFTCKYLRLLNLLFAGLYTIANAFHFFEHMGMGFGVQVILLGFVFLVSIALTHSSFRLWKNPSLSE
ncbi:hypothetical protein CSA37_02730 [Candidatus Fermentibacteria bacterium]|nr:MAG: hypothetical protein CSA37_02730 [Candidatus Fermentibacteria bacterium]